MPTSFGKVSFTIEAQVGSAHVALQVPDRAPLRTLRLRLRLPGGERLTDVAFDGAPLRRFDPETGTIDLPRRGGLHEIEVGFRGR